MARAFIHERTGVSPAERQRTDLSAKNFAILFFLAAIWGASFLFMRISTPVIGPYVTSELRVLLAALALYIFSIFIKKRPNLLVKWKQFMILGAINAAIPFTLISAAELHINASLAAILNATTPLFTALVAWGWLRERIDWKKLSGLVSGLLGVVILVGWSPIELDKPLLYSIIFSLLAALSYAFGGIYASKYFQGEKPLDMAIGQQFGASIVLLPFAIATVPSSMPGMDVILSILGLSIVCTSFAYLLYFELINNVGAEKTLNVTLLVPIFGVVWGAAFLHEAIHATTLIGLAIILLSVILVTKKGTGSRRVKAAGD
ncbi:MAG TPA: DMT family transporter [Bacillaceae bacterium]